MANIAKSIKIVRFIAFFRFFSGSDMDVGPTIFSMRITLILRIISRAGLTPTAVSLAFSILTGTSL
jgi:hypothetical protein